jgi:hypothetical protein
MLIFHHNTGKTFEAADAANCAILVASSLPTCRGYDTVFSRTWFKFRRESRITDLILRVLTRL